MPVYMSADDLGHPMALSFRATADDGKLAVDVRRLEALWGKPAGKGRIGRDNWLRAWRNIRVLASRLLDSLDPQGRCDPETSITSCWRSATSSGRRGMSIFR